MLPASPARGTKGVEAAVHGSSLGSSSEVEQTAGGAQDLLRCGQLALQRKDTHQELTACCDLTKQDNQTHTAGS